VEAAGAHRRRDVFQLVISQRLENAESNAIL